MSSATEEEVKLELKYCEVCGGLWLRASGSLQPYCVCVPGHRGGVGARAPPWRAERRPA